MWGRCVIIIARMVADVGLSKPFTRCASIAGANIATTYEAIWDRAELRDR